MTHRAGVIRRFPLFVKASTDAVGGGFEDLFAIGRERCSKPCESLRWIARPSRQLRAMQILDRHPPASVALPGGDYAVLRIENWKNYLPHVGTGGLQASLQQVARQVIQKAMHNAKD